MLSMRYLSTWDLIYLMHIMTNRKGINYQRFSKLWSPKFRGMLAIRFSKSAVEVVSHLGLEFRNAKSFQCKLYWMTEPKRSWSASAINKYFDMWLSSSVYISIVKKCFTNKKSYLNRHRNQSKLYANIKKYILSYLEKCMRQKRDVILLLRLLSKYN